MAMCKGPLVLKTFNGVASSNISQQAMKSALRVQAKRVPCARTLPFRFLVNDWKSTNSSPQAMRSILRIQQGRVPCTRILTDPYRSLVTPPALWHWRPEVSQRARKSGWERAVDVQPWGQSPDSGDVQTLERIDEPQLHTTRQVSQDTKCVMEWSRQMPAHFALWYRGLECLDEHACLEGAVVVQLEGAQSLERWPPPVTSMSHRIRHTVSLRKL